jgi:hypothetical protein
MCVNGSALVLCGRHMWFLGGRNVLYFVYLRFWYVNPLEQVLAGTHTFSTVRFGLAWEGRARCVMGFRVVMACGL